MSRVLYIPESHANLISLAKLNDIKLYRDNQTLNLYDIKEFRVSVGYISP